MPSSTWGHDIIDSNSSNVGRAEYCMLTFLISFPFISSLQLPVLTPDLNTSAMFISWLINKQTFKLVLHLTRARCNFNFYIHFIISYLIKVANLQKYNFCKQLHLDSFKWRIILEKCHLKTTTQNIFNLKLLTLLTIKMYFGANNEHASHLS